ncbi:hypothetical protein SAMN05421780_1118 [Flexibacter flexilis DSM 6793]|uniref:Uncharacterized protein n=1 Tax=Flexibacter flexilis DSM 6793 TaxID=927664 RepID=A0A1I1MYW0_9BACT|nr:hypothetical protein [Flexibacter flexilis]SFC86730.1 hypothetical protein SAMN05421780_1118 [Flexibacter flexilis DSM 6793]
MAKFYPLHFGSDESEKENIAELFNPSQILRIETVEDENKIYLCLAVSYSGRELFMYFFGDVEDLTKAAIEL